MAIHKLLKNVAVLGTVKYMDYVPEREVKGEKWAAQVSLNGHWDDIGDAKIYLPHIVATAILSDGLAELLPHIEGQDPKFKWSYQGRVQVLKAEEGRSTRTTVLALDAKPKPAIIYAHGEAINGQPPKAQPVTASDDPWAVLGNTYVRARAIARKAWGDEWGNLADDAKAAAVATVFIEANKRGLAPQAVAQPAPQPKPVHTQAAALATATKMRDTFDDFPAALQDDESDPLPF